MTTISDFRPEPSIRFNAAPQREVPREAERKFEDALERKGAPSEKSEDKSKAKQGEGVGEAMALSTPNDVPAFAVQALAGWTGGGSGEGEQGQQEAPDTVMPAGPAQAGTVQAEAPAPTAAAMAPQSEVVNQAAYTMMADRIALPQGAQGSETILTMPDPRWLAREAVIVRDAEGALSVDVGTDGQGDADADGRMLRERLEARGLVVSSVTATGRR